jgi:hypothetical protein
MRADHEPAMKLPLLVMNEVAISFDRRVRA